MAILAWGDNGVPLSDIMDSRCDDTSTSTIDVVKDDSSKLNEFVMISGHRPEKADVWYAFLRSLTLMNVLYPPT